MLKYLKHPSIITVSDEFYENDKYYMVMPYYRKGDLWHRMFKDPMPSRTDILTIARQLTRPLACMHTNGVAHLDVKLENYVEGNRYNFIMIDLEHAQRFEGDYYASSRLDAVVGTQKYMAPEIRNLDFGPTSDVYSLGRVLYTIIARRHPDDVDVDWTPLRAKVPELESAVVAMLQPNPRMRPTIFDVLREVNALLYRCH